MTERPPGRSPGPDLGLGPRTAGLMATLLMAATIGRGTEPLPPEMEARAGKPLPAPVHSSIARSDLGMAATASPEATAAAVGVLERGGNAIDAAVAAAFALGVADLDASGLGGMTYVLIHLADGRSIAIDGTPPTPLAVDPVRLRTLPRGQLLFGHEMATVPTTLAVLEHVRARYGSLSLAELIEPALRIAETGYRVNPSQVIWTNIYYELILRSAYLRLIALGDHAVAGRPADEDLAIGSPGEVRCRPELAATLRRIQRDGTDAFYRGEIADAIEADMIANGGFVRKTDLAMLRVRETRPLHSTYRNVRLISFPSPGGGPAVASALNILENFPSEVLANSSPWRHQLLLEATRIAYADRQSPAESNFLQTSSVLSKEHGRARSKLITAGMPIADEALAGPLPPGCAPAGDSTTQVSVVDVWGNVVSLTQTLGRSFGAKVATPGLGFPYNSLLEGFNVDRPECPGYLRPHLPCPTDMAPSIVLRADGTLLAALGAPGSNRIPAIVTGVISNLVDRGMDLAEAVEGPRVVSAGSGRADAIIEVASALDAEQADTLEGMGYSALERLASPPSSRRIVLIGGVNAVGWDAANLHYVGVGDGRRWGWAGGPEVIADTVAPPPRGEAARRVP